MSSMVRGGVRRFFVVLVCAWSVLPAAAAASAGDIVGMASDATGAVLPAADVSLRNLAPE